VFTYSRGFAARCPAGHPWLRARLALRCDRRCTCQHWLRAGGQLEGHRAQIDADHGLDEGDDKEQPWATRGDQAAKPEDHAALVFTRDPDGAAKQHDRDDPRGPKKRSRATKRKPTFPVGKVGLHQRAHQDLNLRPSDS
jgi:hypothetical protein